MNNATRLSDAEWNAADAELEHRIKLSVLGSPERDQAREDWKSWTKLTSLPERTRDAEQLAFALAHNLVTR